MVYLLLVITQWHVMEAESGVIQCHVQSGQASYPDLELGASKLTLDCNFCYGYGHTVNWMVWRNKGA